MTSGGVDSLVLLNLLIQLKQCHNISLIIFHVNYMLHENSNLMEQICLSNAKSNNLKILISKCDKNLFKNKNIESKARNYRYEKAVEVSKDLNVNYVLTAHHEDDQIETIYMAEKNNSSWVSKIGIRSNLTLYNDNKNKVELIRPLLNVSKKQILAYAKQNKITYVEDPTNKEVRYKRNKVRFLIKDRIDNKSFRNYYLNISKINQNKINELSQEINQKYLDIIKASQYKKICILNKQKLIFENFDFIYLFVKKVLNETFGYKNNLSTKMWISLTDYFKGSNTGKSYIIDHLEFSKNDNDIYVYDKNSDIKNNKIDNLGNYFFSLGCISIGIDDKFNFFKNKEGICVPYEFMSELRIDNWSHGDKCRIKNKKYTKVSDIFINNKLSLFHKKNYPILKHNDNIIWIPNLYCSKIENIDKFKSYLILRWNVNL